MLFCFLRLYWVFIKSECLDVGSGKYLSAVNQPAIILIFKNIAFCRNYLSCLFVMFCFGRVFDWEILDCLLWLFLWLILRLIDEMVCRVCFEGLFFECFWLSGCGDCFFWLFDLIDCSGWLFFIERLWFCEKEKVMVGRCIFIVAVVKPYVKMSAVWFKRLIFWFGRVLFVVKTLLCSERRFANDEKVKSFAK